MKAEDTQNRNYQGQTAATVHTRVSNNNRDTQHGEDTSLPHRAKHIQWSRYLDAAVLVVMCIALLYGVSAQFFNSGSDAAKYQCYAMAFWHGVEALQLLPAQQCTFITHSQSSLTLLSQADILQKMQQLGMPTWSIQFVTGQSPLQPYHALPHEYPFLTLLVFSPALLAPASWYQVAFALVMTLVASAVYVLLRVQSKGAALAYVLYLTVGSWVTALGRFDLLPAALTLLALLCAERTRWKLAFVLLAIATMLKFYPLLLILPFFIAQQRQTSGKWYAWQRYAPLIFFAGTCLLILLVSLLFSVEGALAPLSYFGYRPIQVESLSASVLHIVSMLTGAPLRYAFSYGSRNVFSPLSDSVALAGTLLLLAGLLLLCWLLWRRKIPLSMAMVLTLLVVILTGKVFSAQYLIWLTPIIAYVGKWHWKWLCGWGCICLVTTIIYPFLYNRADYPFGSFLPEFHATVLVRNVLLLGFTGVLFYQAIHNRFKVELR